MRQPRSGPRHWIADAAGTSRSNEDSPEHRAHLPSHCVSFMKTAPVTPGPLPWLSGRRSSGADLGAKDPSSFTEGEANSTLSSLLNSNCGITAAQRT